MKKKLNIKPKAGDGVITKNLTPLQKDSLDMYNYFLLQKQLEGYKKLPPRSGFDNFMQSLVGGDEFTFGWGRDDKFERAKKQSLDVLKDPALKLKRAQQEKNIQKQDEETAKNNPNAYWGNKNLSLEERNRINAQLYQKADSLVRNNPNIAFTNPWNSPDIQHRTIEPVGQYKGIAGDTEFPKPSFYDALMKEEQKRNQPPAQKVAPIIKPAPDNKPITKPAPVVTAPPDTMKVPQYSKIVNGQRVTISKEEYDKMVKGQQATPTGKTIKQDGRVIQVQKYGGTTGMGTVPMMMFEHGGKFGSYDNRDTGYYEQGGYIWQTTPHMKHGGMPAYGQSFPEANWWGYRSSGPSQFTLPYQLDIKLPPPPEREGPIPTYRNEINSTDYDAATFKAGGRVRMKFRGENHEIYQDGDIVYVNHPETRPGKDKGKWKKFNATKEVGAKTIGQAEHAIEEWHNANPGKYEFGGNVTTGQWAILDDDENDLPEAGKGYIVKRSNDRKGKTHVVIGPDGTKKYFGDSKLGQHPKDPERKKAFYARHKKNLANNPYFRAFARKTWEYGGEVTEDDIPMAGDGKKVLSNEEKRKILSTKGILPEQEFQRNALQEKLANNLYPVGYNPSNFINALFEKNKDRQTLENILKLRYADSSKELAGSRLDAYNFYMGKPQKYNTFDISDYRPSKEKDPNATYYKLNYFQNYYAPDSSVTDLEDLFKYKSLAEHDFPFLFSNKAKSKVHAADAHVMANYTLSKGEDEKGKYYSYYDKWDISPMDFGKPFEIYDRIYYDPESNKIIPPKKPYTQKAPLPGQSVPTMEFGKGGMIKRKDGSYSRRGLWDNIRANKGSGKKPTKEMLAQERKIKMKENKAGMGMRLDLNPLPVMPARSAGNGASVIDLHLPKYPDRRTQNLYATPYMFGLSPAKDVNVYGAGASFGVNFLDRGRNTFGATGNVNNTAVSYPGGFEISSDPYRSLGLRYVHRFQKGGMLPKAGGGKAINNPKIPKVVNVFAEAPIEGESRYDLFNRISSDEVAAMPKELQELFSKFSEADKAVQDARNNPELIKVREPWMKAEADFNQFAENIAIKDKKLPSNIIQYALLYNNYDATGEKYDLDETSINYLNTLYNDNKEYIDNLREQKNKYWETRNSIYKPLKDTRNDIVDSFYAHPLNIKDEKPSPTFTTEANDLKKWYATHYPNTKVNVYSGYGEDFKKTIEDVLATGDENTDIAIMGHSGGRYAGLNNEYFPQQGVADEPSSWNWSDAINKSKYQNCYLGTCYGQDVYNDKGFKDVRNLYSTVNSPWLGVSPTAPSLLNAFFGTQKGKKGDFVGTAIQGQQYDKYSAEPKLQNSPMPDKAKISYEKFGGKIKLKKAQTGTQTGYSWSTQQTPTQQVIGSAENPQTSKPAIQPFQKGYVNPKIMTSQTGEEGLGDDLGGMMVTATLAPGSLPFRASSRLGRVALAAGELANPVSGFRGIKPKFALQNADPILTNQTKGFNVEYDGLLDFQKKADFEPYRFDNKNWYDESDFVDPTDYLKNKPTIINPEDRAISELTTKASFGERPLITQKDLWTPEEFKRFKSYGIEPKSTDFVEIPKKDLRLKTRMPEPMYNEGLPAEVRNLKQLENESNWVNKVNDRDFVTEMRRTNGYDLDLEDIKKLSDEKLAIIAKNIKETMLEKAIQSKNKFLKNPKYTGLKAYQEITPNKFGGKISLKNQSQGWQILD